MRIVYCTNHFPPSVGGSEIVSQNIVSELNKNHEVFVFTRSVPKRDFTKSIENIIEYDKLNEDLFLSKIKSLRPDVIFVYSDVFDFFRRLLVSDFSIPIILAPCGANWIFSSDSKKRIFENNANKITKFVCHSVHERDYLILDKLSLADKISIIPNGVTIDEFDKNNLMKSDLITDNSKLEKFWVLNVANFFPEKGHKEMVEVMKRLSNNVPNIHYIQIASHDCPGIGRQLKQAWINQVASELQNISVSLIDSSKRSEIVGFIKQSDVLVCTSIKEVAPLVHLEAMACGTPWVSSSVGNVADLSGGTTVQSVKNRNFRYIYDDSVFSRFAEEISSSLRTGRRLDGKNQINSELNWASILPKYSELFNG